MDKNAIKKYATWARRELIARVSQKAEQYGITEQNPGELHAESVGGRLLSRTEQTQRDALILRVRRDSYRQVMEEVAYTWFNRFCALRFMEVNGYLPTRIRVFTDENNAFKPQILAEAIHMEMDGLDMDRVYQLKSDNKTEELYKYLLVTQCNALSSILSGMFQQIADYTELLLPDNLLREGSVIEQMIALIPEGDWTDQVQIIGWLYQYYNTEPKDQVFADLKKNIKISKEKIPAATQLFTPDWIVRYMVENSLGRLWLECGPQGMSCGNGNDALRELWVYYLDEAEQEPEVQEGLDRMRAENGISDPSEIKCIDPCMGSGHILAYMFDVLMQIYTAYGYSTREAVQSIVENNLYGLDIDDRAAQLAYFAVMMKARQYDRRFFTRGIQPHVAAVQESEPVPEAGWGYFGPEQDIARHVYAAFVDAKEYGSLIEPNVTLEELDALQARLVDMDEMSDLGGLSMQAIVGSVLNVMCPLIEQARMLVQKYDVAVTNPPYMGSSGMGARLSEHVKTAYPDSKSDLFAAFIERGFEFVKKYGFISMITMESWMFLSSFEKIRKMIIGEKTIMALVHMPYLGKGGTSLGINFGTDMAVIRNVHTSKYVGTYDRIAYYETDDDGVPFEFPTKNEYYKRVTQGNFAKIPGAPVAYWWSNYEMFTGERVSNAYESAGRNKTHNNELYVRNWWEISDRTRWQPYANGGIFRRWAGNDLDLVDWSDDAKDSYASHGGLYNQKFLGKQGVCWNLITSYKNGFRIKHAEHHYSSGAPTIVMTQKYSDYVLLAFLNSCVGSALLSMFNPTLNTTVGDVLGLPLPEYNEDIDTISKECVSISQSDWDTFETSWDFQRHPLISHMCFNAIWGDHTDEEYRQNGSTELSYAAWQRDCDRKFEKLKANEEELNRIFIDIYGLQDELTPAVEDRDVTVRKADLGRDIRSLISYAVGCMFGRYSLDVPGLVYAGGDWNESFWLDPVVPDPRYNDNETVMTLDGYYVKSRENQFVPCTFPPDKDNILPICDDEYFEDDIVGRFVKFIEVVYGKDTLEENLKFIAGALGGKGSPRDVIRSYFLNDFYADHLKTYQKRPIYWLFDSGKKNGFKCLIYMHRYAPDTIARIRTDYVHEQQSRYRTAIADLENRIAGAATGERVRLTKQLNKLRAQAEEIRLYEEKIHHLADQMIAIDLDDGVKVNYAKFADVLAKIK